MNKASTILAAGGVTLFGLSLAELYTIIALIGLIVNLCILIGNFGYKLFKYFKDKKLDANEKADLKQDLKEIADAAAEIVNTANNSKEVK